MDGNGGPGQAPDVRYPDKGNVGRQNFGYKISRWNEREFHPGRMCDATRRKGRRLRVQERGSHVAVLRETTIWVVGSFSADHDLGMSGCASDSCGVIDGCINTKGKTAG